MAHLSEDVKRLRKKIIATIPEKSETKASVWFLNLPFFENLTESDKYVEKVKSLNRIMHPESVLAIYTSPMFASEICARIPKDIHYKLWIAVKHEVEEINEGEIRNHHSSLVILSKYKGALKHSTTRIAYTYCPSCEKTTKDYGGKKHLYNPYGTLMSDVWRDISEHKNKFPSETINRIQDLFGIEPYKTLKVIDFNKIIVKNNTRVYTTLKNSNENIFKYKNSNNSILINGDCLESLNEIPSNSIDFCFADPPYNIKKKYENWDDGLDIQEYFDWCDSWLSELARVLKPNRTLAVLNIPQWCIRHFKHLKTELDFQDWIAWEGLSLPVRKIMPAHYGIICFSKGEPRQLPGLVRESNSMEEKTSLEAQNEWYCTRKSCLNKRNKQRVDYKSTSSNLWWDIHRLKHNSRRVDHPCQLPPLFMKRLISIFTNENEIVLDPFNGVGTTTLTCQILNRRYVGIELSEYYHNICTERHQELTNDLDPFRKNDKTPKTKNSHVKRLKKQTYEVPKKVLQLDVRRIANLIGRMPKREDVILHSEYPIKYFDNYFINWAEVCAAARTTGMTEVKDSTKEYKTDSQLRLFKEKKSRYSKSARR